MRHILASIVTMTGLAGCNPAEAPAVETPQAGAAAPAAAAPAPAGQNGFGIATVRVTYATQGPGGEPGSSTLWIEDFGARAALREEMSIGGAPPQRVDTYWDGTQAHTKQGSQPVSRSPSRPPSTEASIIARTSEADREADGWAAKGERTLAGQTCSIWGNDEMGGFQLCVWRGIDLATQGGAINLEASEIVEGERIPADIVALAN